jgi:hypothetical protein
MAENLKKLKYEPGDARDTTERPMTCPSGHPIHKQRGNKFVCTVCDWTQIGLVMGSTPATVVSKNEPSKPQDPTRGGGVTVMSQSGVEQRGRKPNILGR